MLETPVPQPHMHPGHHGTNGVGRAAGARNTGAHAPVAHAAASGAHGADVPAAATRTSSDVLKMLNMPGAAESDGGPPRLMSVTEGAAWTPSSVQGSAARSRNAKLILGLLGIVGIVTVLLLIGTKKPKPVPVAQPKPAATDPFAGMAEKIAAVPPAPPPAPPTVAPPAPEPPPGQGKGRGRNVGRGGRATQPPAVVPGTTAGTTTPPAPGPTTPPVNDGPRERSVNPNSVVSNRPPPSQGDISKVITNNRGGIKNCYQRALLRDNSLTHGKITVRLTLGISGRVKHVGIDGPAQFKPIEPCIKEAVSRWVFPQASEEYGTEFVYVFQGNE
jgi:hypothetical protein